MEAAQRTGFAPMANEPIVRTPCDPNRPTAIPRNPDRDLALSDRAQKVLKAILEGTGDDRRISGRRRWCAWMSNERLLDLINQSGQPKSHGYLDRGLKELRDLGRIQCLSMTEFHRWLIEQAPRYGLPSDRPEAMGRRKGRVILVAAELPPVVSDDYGALRIPPPISTSDALSTLPTLGSVKPQFEERTLPIVGSANRSEIRSEFSETEPILSTSGRKSDDDGRLGEDGNMDPNAEPDEARREILKQIQANPRVTFFRHHLKKYDDLKANPPLPAPCRPVAPPPLPLPVVTPSPSSNASQSRPGPETARRLAQQVRSLSGTGDQGTASRLADEVLDLVEGRFDRQVRAIVTDAMNQVANGSICGDAAFGVVAQLGNKGLTNPRGFAKVEFEGIGARGAKRPDVAPLGKVHDVGSQ